MTPGVEQRQRSDGSRREDVRQFAAAIDRHYQVLASMR
jgi:hypothetical protein